MYIVNNSVEYWLYDKTKNAYTRKFDNMQELRDFIETCIVFHDDARYPYYNICEIEYYTVKQLSMSFEPVYKFYDIGFGMTYHDTRPYVIVDKNLKIYNYSEIVDEIVAKHKGLKISFGIGKTYKGNSFTEKSPMNRYKARRAAMGVISGFKYHRQSRCNLIVNKSERIACNSHLHDNYYMSIADDIRDELGIDVDPKLIKSAYNSMRYDRRYAAGDVWEDGYDYHTYRHGCPESWKNHKKSKQWKNDKNTARQTVRKDYIKHCVDEEYAFDYE